MIADKLRRHFPGASWSMTGETYDTLNWEGPGPIPSEDELAALDLSPTPEEVQVAARQQVDQRLAQVFAGGFAPSHPGFEGRRLQVRDGDDRTNWLTSQASYSAAVAAGQGAVENARFRTADNVTVVLSYADGLATLLEMAAWGAAIMNRGWEIKDAIAAGEAYDLEAGWP